MTNIICINIHVYSFVQRCVNEIEILVNIGGEIFGKETYIILKKLTVSWAIDPSTKLLDMRS